MRPSLVQMKMKMFQQIWRKIILLVFSLCYYNMVTEDSKLVFVSLLLVASRSNIHNASVNIIKWGASTPDDPKTSVSTYCKNSLGSVTKPVSADAAAVYGEAR